MTQLVPPATDARHPSIGLTPLIDVVFILLIFFMLVVQFKLFQQTALSTVQATQAPIAASEAPIVLTLAGDGQCKINNAESDCDAAISSLPRDKGDRVFLAFEPDVVLRRIVEAQQALLLEGFEVTYALTDEGEAS